jgi:hypothetical protein
LPLSRHLPLSVFVFAVDASVIRHDSVLLCGMLSRLCLCLDSLTTCRYMLTIRLSVISPPLFCYNGCACQRTRAAKEEKALRGCTLFLQKGKKSAGAALACVYKARVRRVWRGGFSAVCTSPAQNADILLLPPSVLLSAIPPLYSASSAMALPSRLQCRCLCAATIWCRATRLLYARFNAPPSARTLHAPLYCMPCQRACLW